MKARWGWGWWKKAALFWVLYWTVSVYFVSQNASERPQEKEWKETGTSPILKKKKKSPKNLICRTEQQNIQAQKNSPTADVAVHYVATHVALSNTDIQRYVQAGQQWLLKSLLSPHYAFRERNTPNPAEESSHQIEFQNQSFFFSLKQSSNMATTNPSLLLGIRFSSVLKITQHYFLWPEVGDFSPEIT